MAATTHGDLDAVLPGKLHGGDHVGLARHANDQLRPAVGPQLVPQHLLASGLVVGGAGGHHDPIDSPLQRACIHGTY
jgi:hypothetical protein